MEIKKQNSTSLHKLLGVAAYKVHILDLGAMSIENQINVYDHLLDDGMAELIGIEPLLKECNKLLFNNKNNTHYRFLPFAIGDGSYRELYECKVPSMSSLFPPNIALCSEFDGYAEHMEILKTDIVKTIKLDDIKEITDVDFYKSDIQGSDLMAIQGGLETIKKAVVLEIEVEFVEQYKNQPLFSDIDIELRNLGFCFHMFTGYGTRPLKPLMHKYNKYNGNLNQWLWANAVYLRDFREWGNLRIEKLKSIARIMHDVYSSKDYVCRALHIIDSVEKNGLCKKYRSALIKEGLLS